jgi:hypothetical protein
MLVRDRKANAAGCSPGAVTPESERLARFLPVDFSPFATLAMELKDKSHR